ncbi:MAG: carbamoyltransferase HypF, partial [Desulfamplus sp.]|nr:carbamoyltransferase HypF [Desulfamplus sp.]
MNSPIVAKEFNISGVVQGVGFRPFIFQLAHHYGFKGEVFNTAKGVTIIIETNLGNNSDILGNSLENDLDNLDNIEKFKVDIIDKKPPLAIISEINCRSIDPSHYKDFEISKSSEYPSLSKNSKKSLDNQTNDNTMDNRATLTLISPDVSVCSDCIREIQDPNDRRCGYPFINCTNCGPRYTIIKDVPYDRAKTSMDSFEMCSQCQKEYDDPFDRRFHAQPNACPVCGPHLSLVDSSGQEIANDNNKKIDDYLDSESKNNETALNLASKLLKQGKILAIKGLGGFHLAVDAMNSDAVAELRRRKNRPHKPFALMARSVEAVEHLVDITLVERELLESYHRPIVLLTKKKRNLTDKKSFLSDLSNNILNKNGTLVGKNSEYVEDVVKSEIAPNNPFLGVMLPYTPLHYLLLEKGPSILVMTSGNRSGEPLSIDNQDALDAFSHIADYCLLHNRDIYFRADDSIMQVQNKVPRFFRRSRGYAPIPIILPELTNLADKKISVLGCGAGLKNTVCLTSGNMAFLSQHIGDLENEKVFNFYKQSIKHLKNIFNIEPAIIAHDLHPDYLSTVFANSLKEQKEQIDKEQFEIRPNTDKKFNDNPPIIFVPVQHHHAHAVSCMAENGITGDVVAITLDGTGLGVDGNIWGGEVLVCNELEFERKAHLRYIEMPGGDAAAREPWRMALSYLYAAFGDKIFELEIPLFKYICGSSDSKLVATNVSGSINQIINNNSKVIDNKYKDSKIDFIVQMIKKKINCPLTSSCGRLFDAVSSLCSIRHKITFESQAAIELQAKCKELKSCQRYDFAVKKERDEKLFIIDLIPVVKAVVNDIQNLIPIESISSKFHQTVIDSFACASAKVSLETGLKRVVLSGGVFNNVLILTG